MPTVADRVDGGRSRAAELCLPRPDGTRSSLVADEVGDQRDRDRSKESRARVLLAADDDDVTSAAGSNAATARATETAATDRTVRGVMAVCTSVVVLALSPVKTLCQQCRNRVGRTLNQLGQLCSFGGIEIPQYKG